MTTRPSPAGRRRAVRLAALLVGLGFSLAGCASFSPDGGMGAVAALSSVELGQPAEKIATEEQAASASVRVKALLKKPLTPDAAVRVALLNNRGLQAAYNDLGLAEAQMVAASLPPNPRLSISRATAPLYLEIERTVVASLFALATLPTQTEIARGRFRAAQFRAAEATFRLAADARRQYYRAVAAGEQAAALQESKATAQVTADLFKKLGESGGANKIDQARDFAFYAETGAQLAQARLQARIEREKLARLLGLWGDDLKFRLPGSLPGLPRLQTAKEIEREALLRRVDLQVALADLQALATSLGLSKATRFVNDVDLLARRTTDREFKVNDETGEREKDVRKIRTIELEIEIPIYDFGQSKVAAAEQTYMAAANRLAEKAVNIRSEAREAYQAYRGQADIARLYQSQVLPLRRIIKDESLLQYGGMLIDVTTLIADARARILSNAAAVNAKRDFWLAHVDFKHAIIGGGVGGVAMAAAAGAAEAGAAPH